jgi:triosephosphate isomerase
MRKQIAAANWKMNLSLSQAEQLVTDLQNQNVLISENQQVLLAVPFPYLIPVKQQINKPQIEVAAQNISATTNGAYTGETSAEMLNGISINYAIIGHSERRLYYHESNETLAQKINRAFEFNIKPIFCCGEPLEIRELNTQNEFVETQLKESLFHLTEAQMKGFIIAYEPIWAIGTGKTASSDQAQEMHAHIRQVIAQKYGSEIANSVSILYGGSVKASNAADIFGKPDVDGGLVGGASLVASEFAAIISALKN